MPAPVAPAQPLTGSVDMIRYMEDALRQVQSQILRTVGTDYKAMGS